MHTPRLTLAAIAATTLLLTACGSDDSGSGSGSGTEAGFTPVTAGKLTVCTNVPYEPFEFEQDGEIVGFDIGIVDEVAADLDLEVEAVASPFDAIQSGAALASSQCDLVISAMTINDERAANMALSDPYFDADQGLLVPVGSDLSTVESLADATVAVQSATTGEAWAEENGITPVKQDDVGLQVNDLRAGNVDAVINDVASLKPYVSDEFEVAATFETGEQYGMGVAKDATELLESVNATLERIRTDGTYNALYTEWIGTAPSEG